MKKYRIPALAAFLLLTVFLCFTSYEEGKDKQYRADFKTHTRVYAVSLPVKLDFAGETVPLDTFYIRESLDRELLVNTYWHSNTILMLKRANRYFPVIEPILIANHVPDDFKYLALTESGLLNVVSPSNATGFWQFLDKTAKQYGLEVSEQVDERYNIAKSTEAACGYLKAAFAQYGSWTLAAASYNAGQGKISRESQRQNTGNYYDLYLNPETSRYIFRILALKLICTNPTEYGFYLRYRDLYPPLATYQVRVDTSITDLINFAARQNISYRLLKEFNPWLRTDQLKVLPGKAYTIDLPEKNSIRQSNLLKTLADPDAILGYTEELTDTDTTK